jgi:hypothetical protein
METFEKYLFVFKFKSKILDFEREKSKIFIRHRILADQPP